MNKWPLLPLIINDIQVQNNNEFRLFQYNLGEPVPETIQRNRPKERLHKGETQLGRMWKRREGAKGFHGMQTTVT